MPPPVRVFWTEDVPYVNECSAKSRLKRIETCPNPGIEAEFVDLLLRHVLPDDNETNVQIVPYDSMQTLKNRTFHVVVPGWEIENESELEFWVSAEEHQMSQVYGYTHISALVADTPRIPLWQEAVSVVSVFGLYVWLLLFGTYVLLRAVDHCPPRLAFLRCRNSFRIFSASHTASLVRTWLLFFLSIFTALYSNCLLAQILLKKDVFAFSNTEELVDVLESGRFRLLHLDYTSLSYMRAVQMADEHGQFTLGRLKRVIRDSLETVVRANITDLNLLIGLIYDNPYVMMSDAETCAHLQRRYCGLHCVDIPEFTPEPCVFFLSNANPEFNTRFNDHAIAQLSDSYSPIAQLYKTSLLTDGLCDDGLNTEADLEDSSSLQSLSVDRLSGAFVMLVAGCVIGLVVCAMEKYASFVAKKIRRAEAAQDIEDVESEGL